MRMLKENRLIGWVGNKFDANLMRLGGKFDAHPVKSLGTLGVVGYSALIFFCAALGTKHLEPPKLPVKQIHTSSSTQKFPKNAPLSEPAAADSGIVSNANKPLPLK